ncbi:PqiC family protein [Methyloglobulus sp.]|uniref:PqiC family protein n=1 Tax=Methyloglobulus sp. TaxID=2518622 RepID=UPI0032B86448
MSKLLITALLVLLVTACANAPSVQFYVLEPLSQIAPITVLDTRQHTIGIGPISVPALLERKQIITRHAGNAVEIAEFQQWASPLQDNLLQALTRNISSLQPNDIVRAYPWSVHGTVDLQIVVDIIRFDTTPGKSANLEANWTIKNENTHEILKAGHSVINHSLSDSSYSGAVLALSKVLGEFSQELSLALLNVEMSN